MRPQKKRLRQLSASTVTSDGARGLGTVPTLRTPDSDTDVFLTQPGTVRPNPLDLYRHRRLDRGVRIVAFEHKVVEVKTVDGGWR